MEMPLVSIILPVYNAQSHLNRCLGSICAQQYEDLEIIVINDGSKDQSLPVCEEFRKKDSRILLVDKANSGVSDTRNLGLKLASGKYVQFVDSDDYIAPDYTARLVEAAEKSGADLVISPYTMVIPAGASKPEQVLEKIQDDLGVMHVARPPETREYGFLPAGIFPISPTLKPTRQFIQNMPPSGLRSQRNSLPPPIGASWTHTMPLSAISRCIWREPSTAPRN